DVNRVDPLLYKGREGRVNVSFVARVLDVETQPKNTCRRLHVARFGLRIRIGLVDEVTDRSGGRDQLVQQLQPFRPECVDHKTHTGDVATRPVEAGNETKLDRVGAGGENDWYGRRHRFGCERRRGAPGCGDHGHLTAD